MDIGARLAVSYYKTIADIDPVHGVSLVQHVQTKQVFIKKELRVYRADVYRQLKACPVRHTPRIYELYEEDGLLTVIEEYVQGDTLEALLSQGMRFSTENVRRWAAGLCDILMALHAMTPPVIHRDIKPSNCILASDGQLVLLDLNAARQYDGSKAEDTELLGTRGYAAPEQYGFGESGVRTDIYGVGALMHCLLTGSTDPRVPVPGPLGPVIRTCMKLNPQERYPSAAALKEALLAVTPLAGGASEGRPAERPEQKSRRRFLPPGFRSGHPLSAALSVPGYILLLIIVLKFPSTVPPQVRVFDKICFGITVFSIVLFSGNYLDIQRRMKILPRFRGLRRVLLVILLDLLLFLTAAAFSSVAEHLILGL